MLDRFKSLLGRPLEKKAPARDRLAATQWPAAVYAVGDVHGCLDLLTDLQDRILADAEGLAGEKWIVMLGDYVDRGEQSAGVLDFLGKPLPAGFKRICLAGNHEVMMLGFLASPQLDSVWLRNGGDATLRSYGLEPQALFGQPAAARIAVLDRAIPHTHRELLRSLPVMLTLPGLVFAHAGIRPGVPIEEQVERDLLWIREEFLDAELLPSPLVVHGHTPNRLPVVRRGRVGIDTGAFGTGILTALKIGSDGTTGFLQSNTEALRLSGKHFP